MPGRIREFLGMAIVAALTYPAVIIICAALGA
jgi:hypothetical protein